MGCGSQVAPESLKPYAGASAVQVYSALIYEGPGLIGRIKRDLAARLRAEGFADVAEASAASR